MSINDKFTYLQQTKEKIKTAIQNKGVDVSDADTFRSYAEKIALIEGGGSIVVEPEENFDIYRAYDVDIDENRIASNFSQYAWIDGKNQDPSATVVNVTTKLKLTNVSTLQSSFFATIYVKNSRFGMWENDTSSEKLGSVTIKTNTWYWVQCVFDVSNRTYNHYVLEDNEQKYTLSTLPPVSEWSLNIENGNRSAPRMELISIGNNSLNYNDQYIRGSVDLNGTKIVCEDGTVWTPYSKKSTPTVSGETTWAYHTGQAVAGDKVMLTKVNSITTPDEAFCNGFYPNYIFNGYAYGTPNCGEVNATQRRQIVDGVIDSSYVNVSGTSRNSINVPHFGLNGTGCYEIALNSTSNFDVSQGFNSGRFITGTSVIQPSGQGRICLLENYVAVLYHGSGGWNNLFKYDTGSQITTNVAARGTNSFAFEDGSGKYVYFARDFTLTSGNYGNILRYNVETNTYDDLGLPSCTRNTSANLSNYNQIFLQTKDYKYLLNVNAYIDLDVENNTYTFNDYPPVILDAIGDRGILSMQVFYDGYFGIQLSEGTTLMCKYTNSMEDVEIKEIVEPFVVEGDSTIYHRHFSPDRLHWFIRPQYGVYNNGAPLSSNPAGPYKAKEATSDYVAYTPSKDRFNSTVLSGFLTGEIKEEDGRLMVEVKTALGI